MTEQQYDWLRKRPFVNYFYLQIWVVSDKGAGTHTYTQCQVRRWRTIERRQCWQNRLRWDIG